MSLSFKKHCDYWVLRTFRNYILQYQDWYPPKSSIQTAMMPRTDVYAACTHCIQMLHPKDRGWASNNRLTSNQCQLWICVNVLAIHINEPAQWISEINHKGTTLLAVILYISVEIIQNTWREKNGKYHAQLIYLIVQHKNALSLNIK